MRFNPYKKGGGCGQVFSHAEGGGQKMFWGSLNMRA